MADLVHRSEAPEGTTKIERDVICVENLSLISLLAIIYQKTLFAPACFIWDLQRKIPFLCQM